MRAVRGLLVWVLVLSVPAWLGGCAGSLPPPKPAALPQARPTEVPPAPPKEAARVQEGVASWYGPGFHGNPTSSGVIYDMYQMTAAHPTLPLGTKVQVTNLENHRTVEVTINDRGPFVKERVIDLSYSAAKVLDMVGPGTARVRVEIVEGPKGGPIADFSLKPFYTLQLGAFNQRGNAEALQWELDSLLGKGSAQIVPARLGTQEVFRVRMGRFSQRDEAVAKGEELAKKGFVVLVLAEYPGP